MPAPETIDREAVSILQENDWRWDGYLFAFRRMRRPDRESTEDYQVRPPDLITYEELSDRGLTGTDLTEQERDEALQWLARRVENGGAS